MSEWIPMDRWAECNQLQRPGIIFELQNAVGQSVFTTCLPAPYVPGDWKSAPIRFRAIAEPKPERSLPIPEPAKP
jgi:hypothetical protein